MQKIKIVIVEVRQGETNWEWYGVEQALRIESFDELRKQCLRDYRGVDIDDEEEEKNIKDDWHTETRITETYLTIN